MKKNHVVILCVMVLVGTLFPGCGSKEERQSKKIIKQFDEELSKCFEARKEVLALLEESDKAMESDNLDKADLIIRNMKEQTYKYKMCLQVIFIKADKEREAAEIPKEVFDRVWEGTILDRMGEQLPGE